MDRNRKSSVLITILLGIFLMLFWTNGFSYSERITDKELMSRSSAIIIGIVEEISLDEGFVRVHVTESLKGGLIDSVNIFFKEKNKIPLIRRNFTNQETAIFCLEKKDKVYWLVPAYRAKITISSRNDSQVTLFEFYIALEGEKNRQKEIYLLDKLTSQKWKERLAALTIINQTEIEDDQVFKSALLQTLNDKKIEVKIAGVGVLGNKKIREAVTPLLEIVGGKGPQRLRVEVIMALGQIGNPSAIGSLLNALIDKNPKIREKAAFSLIYFRDDRKIGPLIRGTRDPVGHVRRASVSSLENIKEKEVIDALIERLSDSDEGVRQEAFRLLQLFTGKSFEYNPFDPLHLQESINRWRTWWKESKEGFEFQ